MAGYAWLLFNSGSGHLHTGIAFCPFKKITGIPCPACGTTRALLALLHGQWIQALQLNPLALPAALFLLITPLWIAADIAARRQSYWLAYYKAEQLLRKKTLAIPALLFIITNWIWNISKGL